MRNTRLKMLALILGLPLGVQVAIAQANPVADHLAACKAETGTPRRRLEACTKAIGDSKDEDIRAEALVQRGVLRRNARATRRGDCGLHRGDQDRCHESDRVLQSRGNVYDQQGQHELAIADYSEAIKLDRTTGRVQQTRPGLRQSGQQDLAIADYTTAIRLAPTVARPYYNRALALFAKSDHKGALADFDQAIKLEPTTARHSPIARCARGNGQSRCCQG